MIQTVIATVLGLVLWNSNGWAACLENCARNITSFNGQIWTAWRNPDNTITVLANGALLNPQPGGLTPSTPALEAYNGRVVIVARGVDDRVYANTWTGSV